MQFLKDLLFAFNIILPIVLIIALGNIIKKIKNKKTNEPLIKKSTFDDLNKLCFRFLLPISLFKSIYDASSIKSLNIKLMFFIVISLVIIFLLGLIIVIFFVKDNRQKGVILQGYFRSNYAIIGIPLASAIAGEEGLQVASLVALVTIPVFNILATISLIVFVKEQDEKALIKKTLIKIIKNPLIIGVLLGIFCLAFRIILEKANISFRLKDISFFYETIKLLGSIASPLALLTLGGLFEFSVIKNMKKQICTTVIIRLVIIPIIVFTLSLLLFNFNKAEYATMIAIYASPVAVSSAIMAKEMNNDSDLASQIVVWTTIFSTITIFIFIYVFRLINIF